VVRRLERLDDRGLGEANVGVANRALEEETPAA
jgi:hypothetical protein